MARAELDDVAAALVPSGTTGMTAMKLQKLVYYVQAWHLAEYGEPAFDEPIEAWRQGPVIRRLYESHRGWRRITRWAGNAAALPRSVLEVVEAVQRRYGTLSADELSEITHREDPWREARTGLSGNARSGRPIDPDVMRRFYATQGGQRRTAVEDVLASARLEGAPDDPDDRALLEGVVSGSLSADDAVRQIIADSHQ